jgi:hypothetical protein
MSRFRFRSFVDDALFVVLVMVAAVASAALETSAVFAGWPAVDGAVAAAVAPFAAPRAAAAASAVDARPVSVAAARSTRRIH